MTEIKLNSKAFYVKKHKMDKIKNNGFIHCVTPFFKHFKPKLNRVID